MPARISVAKRFEMFDRTVAGMGPRLLWVRAPAEMMTALRWGLDEPNLLMPAACGQPPESSHLGVNFQEVVPLVRS